MAHGGWVMGQKNFEIIVLKYIQKIFYKKYGIKNSIKNKWYKA
jgi:hypothetical protein